MCDFCTKDAIVLATHKTSNDVLGSAVLDMGLVEEHSSWHLRVISHNKEKFPSLIFNRQIFYCPMCGRRL